MEAHMQTDTVKLLAVYNQAADAKMGDTIKTLSVEEWGKGLGGFYPSIRSLCVHLFTGDISWLKRFANLREFAAAKDPLVTAEYNRETLFPGVEEYLEKRAKLDEILIGFSKELSDEDLAKNLEYSTPRGEKIVKNFGGCIIHSFNHDTHHRGMISLYLELLGKANDFNSLTPVL
jgi:uncharacterized damage-inducible protein DinB